MSGTPRPADRSIVYRPVARALLIDEQRRVLLFSGIDRTKPDMRPWWFTVGGAIEPGETAQQAAIREIQEETGLTVTDTGPVVFTQRFDWEFEGSWSDQEEWYFVVKTQSFEPSPEGWTETEAAIMRGHRWWTVAELRVTSETVFPECLPDLLERNM